MQLANADAAIRATEHGKKAGFWALTLGSIGVVYGDIGTSPLYAFREAMVAAGASHGGVQRDDVLGVLSLIIWALIIIVTLKYVLILLRADNQGEGGTLTLLALAQRALGRSTPAVLALGMLGAALFYGDALITPAISVLSAVEGLKLVTQQFEPYVLVITVGIILGLFMVQFRGTAAVAGWFGPITLVWFIVMALGGLAHLVKDLSVLESLNPAHALHFVLNNGTLGLIALGAVFLAVTGAEALYADLGHFGRKPIQFAWMFRGLSCSRAELSWAGRAASGRSQGHREPVLPPFPKLGTAAGRDARDLCNDHRQPGGDYRGLFAHQAGDPAETAAAHANSAHLRNPGGADLHARREYAAAARRAGFGAGLRLLFKARKCLWHCRHRYDGGDSSPRADRGAQALELAAAGRNRADRALSADRSRFPGSQSREGARRWVCSAHCRGFCHCGDVDMGARHSRARPQGHAIRDSLTDLLRSLDRKMPPLIPGTAVFLTAHPQFAPVALMHSLKHFKSLHEHNVILTIVTADVPRIRDEDRVVMAEISDRFRQVTMTFGYMEEPNVPRGLALCRKLGWKFDIMSTSFLVSRRSLRLAAHSVMPNWQSRLFILLARNSAAATDYFHIPPGAWSRLARR